MQPHASQESIARTLLGELGEILPGYPSYRSRGRAASAIPVVGVRDLRHANEIGWKLEEVEVANPESIARYRLLPGDVLIGTRGSALSSAIAGDRWTGKVFTSNLLVVRLAGRLLPEFLLAYLQSPAIRQKLADMQSGSTIPYLSPKRLAELEIPVPPLARQRELADFSRQSSQQYDLALQAATIRRNLAQRILLDAMNFPVTSGGEHQ